MARQTILFPWLLNLAYRLCSLAQAKTGWNEVLGIATGQ